MEPQEKLTTQQFIIDRLHDIQRKAEASRFADALASMKEVKAADVKNIYLIALEKQIAKLTDPALSVENRSEIIKSLPAMIERAINDAQRRASMQKADEAQKGQKEAALEKLKSQYFQRADDYVEKGEYQRALEEIRRIYIIEPGSVVAKEYEQKIEQLASLQARGQAVAAPADQAEEKSAETPAAEQTEAAAEAEPEAAASKSKLYIIAAAVVVLAVGAWLIFSRGSAPKQEPAQVAQQNAPSRDATPASPTTTTATPQPSTESRALTESPKVSEPSRKPAEEHKAAPAEQRPAPTRTSRGAPTASPARPQPQPAKQAPQQPASRPAASTPAPQPAVSTPAQPPVSTPASQSAQQPAAEPPAKKESGPAPMPFVAIESPPECIKREAPKYPDIAEKMRIEGKVIVEVTVDAQGKPIQAKVVRSTSDVFDEASVEAAMKSTYKPAMMSTGPVTAKVLVPFTFKIAR
jgi:protein TonB